MHDNLMMIRELTERLDYSESDLTRFWEISPDMYAITDTDGKFLEINDSWSKILGWSKDELLSSTWFKFIHINDLKYVHEVAQMDIDTSITFNTRCQKKSGRYISIEWNVTKCYDNKYYITARPIHHLCLNCPEKK